MEVEGWTNRPHVAPELAEIWTGFAEWVWFRPWSIEGAVAYAGLLFHDRSTSFRSLVVWVWLQLARRWDYHDALANAKAAEPID